MHYVTAKGILAARGCQHGFIYCDARSRCYQMNHVFEDIEVTANRFVACAVGSPIYLTLMRMPDWNTTVIFPSECTSIKSRVRSISE